MSFIFGYELYIRCGVVCVGININSNNGYWVKNTKIETWVNANEHKSKFKTFFKEMLVPLC
jgi:hypothetical protein